VIVKKKILYPFFCALNNVSFSILRSSKKFQ